MQERKKKRIVIASVLKPMDEPRMFAKLGNTLAALGHEVYITGHGTSHVVPPSSITFFPLGKFSRLSLSRLLAPFRSLRYWMSIHPDTIIVCTHELLFVGVLATLFRNTQLVYDVQENYYCNLRYTNAFPLLLRVPVALYVRTKEWFASLFIHHFLLAEGVYEKQLPFVKRKFSILENRFRQADGEQQNTSTGYHNLLFTGTLAESTGVWQAIEWATSLYALDNRFTLTIVGHAPQHDTLTQLEALTRKHKFIALQASAQPVPHAAIRQAIISADVGIIWYPSNKSTEGRIPTKYFEYTALGLKILAPRGQSFSDRLQSGGLTEKPTPHQLLALIPLLTRSSADAEVIWEAYSSTLKQIFPLH